VSLNVPDALLLGLMLAAAVWAILTADLLRSAIGLAATSAILTLLLFRTKMPLAGVFELSVCAGLITVVFISTISLTKPATDEQARAAGLKRWKRYVFLPLVLVAAGALLAVKGLTLGPAAPPPLGAPDVQHVLWNLRRFDLLGQILVILAGVFGVVVLFKARREASEGTKE
jgi:NADH-quinone oxidoreductase subunit J